MSIARGRDLGRPALRFLIPALCLVFFVVVFFFLSGLLSRRAALALTITEIMYHPSSSEEAAVGGRNLEWVELYNDDPTVLNLSGYFFSNGISFTIPYDTYLEGRSYLVVCADEQAVRDRYGITNTVGDFQGRLDNDRDTIELNIFGGGPEIRVSYRDGDQWPHAADGTGHSLVLKGVYLDPDDNDNWTYSQVMGGTPGGPNFDEPTIVETVVLSDDETWRYLKGTSPFPAGWQDLGFNDIGWLSGRTGIGYGDGDDRTVLSDMQNGYWSFAARKTITLTQEQIDGFDDLSLEISFDDGFIFSINGTEIARSGLGNPGSPVAHDAPATSHEASGPEPFPFAKSILRAGENVLACEIHNTSFGSSDSSFIPRIVSQRLILPSPAGDPVPVVINEVQFRTANDGWLELYNTSLTSVDLSDFHLSTDRNDLGMWTLPGGSVIPARGFLTVTEADSELDFVGVGETISFYLTRPGLDEVISAELFEKKALHDPPLDGFSEARYPDGSGRFSVSTTPTPGAANQVALETRVVINEIFYRPPRERAGLEFVELHNRSQTAVDLSGFRFSKGLDYEFAGATVPPGGYVVVAKNPEAVEDAHSISGVLGPYEGVLSDNGELLRLVDPLGNIADEVRYSDGGRWSALADGGGSSLELQDPWQDNSVASAWEASDESSKSRWEQVIFSIPYARQDESEFHIRMLRPSECYIDAISVRRGGTEHVPDGDFESSPLSSAWIIQGNHIQSHRTTEDAFTGVASLKIVATGDGDTRVNRIERETSPFMQSGSYTVSLALRWLRGGNLIYFSCYRQPLQFQQTFWMSYPENLGSPGARNSVAVENLGPVISEVMHSPAVPASGLATTVRARVSDSDGVVSVAARYWTGSPQGNPDTAATATLFDDGVHDDGAPDDGLYAGAIPGYPQDTKMVYFIEAEDEMGAVRRFPREAPARTLVYLHDAPLSARGFTYRIVHDNSTWNQLNSRQLHSNELLDATFVFDESLVYYNVGTRYRGSPWNRPGNPRMYRVRFGEDARYRGRTAINISRYGNAQRERAAYYAVWRNSTLTSVSPKSRSAFARVKTSAGTWTMEHIEPVNRDYLKLWFAGDHDGFLMKINGKQTFDDFGGHRGNLIQWATYQYKGTNKAAYRWNYSPRTREVEDNFDPVVALMQKLSGSSAVLDNELEDIMDVEQFLRVYAARCAHDDWDTIAIGNGQNAYVYYAPIEGRWKLCPWDMDHSWGNTGARVYPDAESRFRNVILRPKYRRRYAGILNEMINGRGNKPGYWRGEEMVTKVLDRNTAAVGPDGVQNASGIRGYINGRRGALSAQIPPFVKFEITTSDNTRVDAATASITGNAWVDVYEVLVNGKPTPFTWPSLTVWQTTVPVEGGPNELSFLAFDVEGNLVGSDEINVVSTFGWASPGITDVDPEEAMPGEVVEIAGTEFHDGIEVFFSGVSAAGVDFSEGVDPTSLTAVVPLLPPGAADVTVRNVDERSSAPVSFSVLPLPPQFVRGDANLDRILDISDPIRILAHLFRGFLAGCFDAADADNNERLNITDAIFLLNYLFSDGSAPPLPYPDPGNDPDEGDPLDCAEGVDIWE